MVMWGVGEDDTKGKHGLLTTLRHENCLKIFPTQTTFWPINCKKWREVNVALFVFFFLSEVGDSAWRCKANMKVTFLEGLSKEV